MLFPKQKTRSLSLKQQKENRYGCYAIDTLQSEQILFQGQNHVASGSTVTHLNPSYADIILNECQELVWVGSGT